MAATWTVNPADIVVTDRDSKLVSVTATRTDAADPGSPRTVTVPGVLVKGSLAAVGAQVVEDLHRKAREAIASDAKKAALEAVMATWPAWLMTNLDVAEEEA